MKRLAWPLALAMVAACIAAAMLVPHARAAKDVASHDRSEYLLIIDAQAAGGGVQVFRPDLSDRTYKSWGLLYAGLKGEVIRYGDNPIGVLNLLGGEGWQLLTIQNRQTDGGTTAWYYFQRPL